MTKINKSYSAKIQALMAKDKVDDVIIELSKLANNSKWLRDELIKSTNFKDIEGPLIDGTISIEESSDFKNRVRDTILNIILSINNSSNSSFAADIEAIEKWDKKEEIRAILESIYKTINTILFETEEILSPLFENNYTFEEVQIRMILLFNTQRKRGNFKRWIIYLTEQLKLNSFSEHSTKTIDDAIFFLNDVFYTSFYEILPENLDSDNLHIPINYLQGQYKYNGEGFRIKEFDVKIVNPSQNKEVIEMQRLMACYLYGMRCSVMDFEGVIEWLE